MFGKVYRILEGLFRIQVFVGGVACEGLTCRAVQGERIAAFFQITVEAVLEDQSQTMETPSQSHHCRGASRFSEEVRDERMSILLATVEEEDRTAHAVISAVDPVSIRVRTLVGGIVVVDWDADL